MTTDANAPSPRSAEVVALEGEIDLHESPQVTQRLNPLIARKLPSIHLDLSRVSYIDSSGLAAFVDAMQRIQAYGGEFALDRHAGERAQDFRDFAARSGVQDLSGWRRCPARRCLSRRQTLPAAARPVSAPPRVDHHVAYARGRATARRTGGTRPRRRSTPRTSSASRETYGSRTVDPSSAGNGADCRMAFHVRTARMAYSVTWASLRMRK